MGRPVNSRWMGGDIATASGKRSASQFLCIARIAGQSAAECVIMNQKGPNKFTVALDSDNSVTGICTLVNRVEASNATDGTNALQEGEMILNAKRHTNANPTNGSSVIVRVMKLFNRTLQFAIDADDAAGTYKAGTWYTARWSFASADLAAAGSGSGDLEVVQLEEAAMAGQTTDFVGDSS